MFRKFNYSFMAVFLAVLFLLTACSSATPLQQQGDGLTPQSRTTNGVQLWADNCARCHNMRPPESYSDAQWDVAVMHMRVRANLTAEDANAIVQYLKSAN